MHRSLALACVVAMGWSAAGAENNKPLPSNPNLRPVTAEDLDWSGDLASALAAAAKENKLVFIDFTGESCTNCRINEKNVFVKTEVKEQFKRYVRVQIYADTVPEKFYSKAVPEAQREKDGGANAAFQKASFGVEQLPFYVIVKPVADGAFEKVAAYDEGRIKKIDKFIEFLKKPLDAK
jgi:hypothetical protein